MSAEHVIGEPEPLEGPHVEPSVGAITKSVTVRRPGARVLRGCPSPGMISPGDAKMIP